MLTMKAKYALKALVILARNKDDRMQVKEIAAAANIPNKFLETILGELRNRELVNSLRGAKGGFQLAREAKKIMVGDVIRIMDGPMAPLRCTNSHTCQPCENCPKKNTCSLHTLMKDAQEALSSVFDRRSIYDLAFFKNQKKISSKNGGGF